MSNQNVVIALSLGGALAFAASSSLKHASAGSAPDAQSMHPGRLARFVQATVSHPFWLAGIACDVAGLTLQVIALHLGALSVVQPLLISGLLFALLLRQCFENSRLTRRQLGWAVVLTAALAGFLLLAAARPAAVPEPGVDRQPAVIAGIVGALLAAACVELGRRQRGPGRSAALIGVAVGIVYAASAALLKAVTDIGARAPLRLLYSWQLYAVVIVGALGMLLNQLAFQAGPLSASLPATATIDPLLSIVVGIAVYDEHVRRGPGGGLALLAMLILMGIAVIQLAAPPLDGPQRRERRHHPENERCRRSPLPRRAR